MNTSTEDDLKEKTDQFGNDEEVKFIFENDVIKLERRFANLDVQPEVGNYSGVTDITKKTRHHKGKKRKFHEVSPSVTLTELDDSTYDVVYANDADCSNSSFDTEQKGRHAYYPAKFDDSDSAAADVFEANWNNLVTKFGTRRIRSAVRMRMLDDKPTERVQGVPNSISTLMAKYYSRRVSNSHNRLPIFECTNKEMGSQRPLLMRPVFVSCNSQLTKQETDDADNAKPYNYQEPINSLYCPQQVVKESEEGRPSLNFAKDEKAENAPVFHTPESEQQDLLVDFKEAIWESLILKTPKKRVADEEIYANEIQKVKLSDINIQKVPKTIIESNQNELIVLDSCERLLQWFADQNVAFTDEDEVDDLATEPPKHFGEDYQDPDC